MKSIDIKSVIIGVLGTVLVFVSIGATDKNLGNITVDSIRIESEFGKTLLLSSGIVITDSGNKTYITSSGISLTKEDKMSVHLAISDNGSGVLQTFNKHGVKVGLFGSHKDGGDGMALLYDRYGDTGWGESGKK